MGQYAEDIIDGTCDWQGDYSYKDNQRVHHKYKETPAEKNIRKVRKELAILIKKYQKEGVQNAVEKARQHINLKYGKGWRDRGLIVNSDNQWKPLSEYKEPLNN